MFESFSKGVLRLNFLKKVVGNDIVLRDYSGFLILGRWWQQLAQFGTLPEFLHKNKQSNKDSKRNTDTPSDKRRDKAPSDSGRTNKVGRATYQDPCGINFVWEEVEPRLNR